MRFSSIFLPYNSPLIKAVVVIFLVFGLSSSSFAQRYLISPSASDTMIDFAPSVHYSHFIFNIQNLTDGELLFHWQQVSTDIPAGWIVGMCDYGHCYGQLGMSGTMDPLPNTGTGIFALGVDPQNISGQAIVSYALWEEASPTEVDTITWVISSNGANAIVENQIADSRSLAEKVYVMDKSNLYALPWMTKGPFFVFQNNGQVLYQGQKNDAGLFAAMQHWQPGLYFVHVFGEDAAGKVYRFQLN